MYNVNKIIRQCQSFVIWTRLNHVIPSNLCQSPQSPSPVKTDGYDHLESIELKEWFILSG